MAPNVSAQERGTYIESPMQGPIQQKVEPLESTTTTPVKTYEDVVLCNCYRYVQSKTPIPRMATLQKTASTAFGNVAVFNYDGVPHVAYVEGMGVGTFTISETNYRRCKFTRRDVSFADPNLVGFYQSELAPPATP